MDDEAKTEFAATTAHEAAEADELVSVKGEIIDISSKFWSEGWGFGKIRSLSGKKDVIKITGLLEGFQVGMHVSIVGKYHSGKYGLELKIETIMADNPSDMRGIRQWLIDRIPQIGPKRAEEVARKFGDRIWDVLEEDPYLLMDVPGITAGRVDEIVRAWAEHKKEREKYVPFYDLGLTHREAKAADKSELEPSQIYADPFVLYLHLPMMSFARNEILAGRTTAHRTAPSRLIAAAIQVLKDAACDGHTAVDEAYVVEHAAALGSVPWSKAREGLEMAIEHEFLSPSDTDGMIMLPKYATAESGIASKINHLLLEPEHGRDHPRPDTGRGSQDDAHREGGHRDRGTGDGEEHDPGELPGTGDEGPESGALCADGEGGETDR
jgi:exodeoxyribonuclease V alpha subunit